MKSEKSTPNSLAKCLNELKSSWERERNHLARLWQDWPKIAGEPLASNSKPLKLNRKILLVGASQPQWLQALQYTRAELLNSLRSFNYEIKDIRIQQYHPSGKDNQFRDTQENIWAKHPSRVDIHGSVDCSICGKPSSSGELKRWGKCVFCLRSELKEERQS